MHRFFTDASHINNGVINITGDDVSHITKVLRLREGDEISVCDKAGTDYICTVAGMSMDAVTAEIVSSSPCKTESNINITLYQGIAKGDKMDYIIQKCVELGVNSFVPVVTKRTVVKITDGDKKTSRWQKIAAEAAKQSVRGIIPTVSMPMNFKDIVKSVSQSKDALNIMAYENESNIKLKNIIKNSTYTNVNIIIGPEGGFDEAEALLARNSGINTVTLGPRILRTETAPVAVCSALMYELGDW